MVWLTCALLHAADTGLLAPAAPTPTRVPAARQVSINGHALDSATLARGEQLRRLRLHLFDDGSGVSW